MRDAAQLLAEGVVRARANDKDTYGKMMAPMAATLPDDAALNNVVAYIKTLPDSPAPATVKGNAKDGHGPYRKLAACHGAQGQGIKATNAPRPSRG